MLAIYILGVAQLEFNGGFKSRRHVISHSVLWKVGVGWHGPVQTSGQVATLVKILITHDLLVLVIQILAHSKHPCCCPTAGAHSTLVETDEVRLAPWVRSSNARCTSDVLIEELQIIWAASCHPAEGVGALWLQSQVTGEFGTRRCGHR